MSMNGMLQRHACADAVLVTAPTAFAATQQAIGLLQFFPLLANMKPGDAFGDPAGCLTGDYVRANLQDLLMRQIRCGAVMHHASVHMILHHACHGIVI